MKTIYFSEKEDDEVTTAVDWTSHQQQADLRDISPLMIELSEALTKIEFNVTSAVENYYEYEYGNGDITSIVDGGNDMYDEGNMVIGFIDYSII